MLAPPLHKGFVGSEQFKQRPGSTYTLLPFRLLRLDTGRYIVTNFVGEFAVLPSDDLQALVAHRLDQSSTVYDDLKAKHFLLDGDSNVALDLLACKYRTKQCHLPDLTSLFMFVVTLRCEHSCPYCQVSRQSQNRRAFDMKEEDAERAIDCVVASPCRRPKVEFQGGEPLLNFGLIRSIVTRVKERLIGSGRDAAFVIATNLALLTDEVIDFCREHDMLISTSLDGPRSLHNANRPRPGGDSYEQTIEGIARVRAALGRDRVSALMTTTKASLSQPEAIVDEYVSQGFTSIFLRPLSPFGFAVKTGVSASYSTSEWLQFYRRGLNYILDLNLSGTPMREEYAALLLRKMLTPFPTSYVDLQSPAGIGISAIAFNYDGNVYASDEARMLAEMGDFTFRLGHLSTHTYPELVLSESLLETLGATMTESMPMCSDCGVQPFCGSDPVYHHAVQHDAIGFKPASGFCHKNMEIIRDLIRTLEDDPRRARVLRSWVL